MEHYAQYAPTKLTTFDRTRIQEYLIPDAHYRERGCGLREDLWDELTEGSVDLAAFASSRHEAVSAVLRHAQRIAACNDSVVIDGTTLKRVQP